MTLEENIRNIRLKNTELKSTCPFQGKLNLEFLSTTFQARSKNWDKSKN